ncbi:hypothetical protein [Anaerococcus vaginimassiliensis]|uniref:hypothetical protein n=1 Tax=Anaerococcus vaginimassiliensis TaxID=2042308 RepID=UPI001031EEAB|nr:hypothetical protein [Anaerococcus vaginimassiliensis]
MNNIVTNIILTILTAALFIGLKYLTEYINENKYKIKDERAKRAIEKALEIVSLAVNITNQTFVQELKDKGGFGKKEAEEAFNATKVKVIEMLDSETKKILENEFENSNKFLNEAIEAKVWENKNKK